MVIASRRAEASWDQRTQLRGKWPAFAVDNWRTQPFVEREIATQEQAQSLAQIPAREPHAREPDSAANNTRTSWLALMSAMATWMAASTDIVVPIGW